MKHTLYWISRIFFYCFITLFIFLSIFSILGFGEYYLEWDVPFVEINRQSSETAIFVNPPFLGGGLGFPPNAIVIIPIIIFGFYSFYFYRLHQFFKIFISDSLFHKKATQVLRKFYYINLIVVIIAIIATIVEVIHRGYFKIDESQLFIIIHGCIAIITYLYLDMAQKGSVLQTENDLTI